MAPAALLSRAASAASAAFATFATLAALLSLAAGACTSSDGSGAVPPAGAPGGSPSAPPRPETPPQADDAGDGDAGDDAAPLAVTFYPRVGDVSDDTTPPAGPGLVLMGGTNVDAAFAWARERLGGTFARAFDAVVVEAGGADTYAQYLYDLAPFRSAQTIAIPASAGPADFAAAAAVIADAELVFFPGGQQSAYAVWAGTPVMQAVQSVYDRGGVVGGTSAGALVLGAFVFDAIAAKISENVTPEVALADPFDARISFTRHMLNFPPLADAITEVHFEARDRMGRLAMFMARQHTDGAIARTPKEVLGVAIDEGAAVVITGAGAGSLVRDPGAPASARAFLVRGGAPSAAEPGQRLVYPALEVHRLDDPSQTFDFMRWCGTAPVYTIDVTADPAQPFGPESPYDRPGASSPCP